MNGYNGFYAKSPCGNTVLSISFTETHKSAVSQVIIPLSGFKKQLFAWNEKAFGPGLDNDLLMRAALDMLRKLDPGDLPLTIAVPDFYQELAAEGKVTKGTVLDFIATRTKAPTIMLMSTANKPSQIVAGTISELAATGREHKVLLGIELRRRDWNDFTRIMTYVVREHRKHPEFRGLFLTPLVVLEFLITEQN